MKKKVMVKLSHYNILFQKRKQVEVNLLKYMLTLYIQEERNGHHHNKEKAFKDIEELINNCRDLCQLITRITMHGMYRGERHEITTSISGEEKCIQCC